MSKKAHIGEQILKRTNVHKENSISDEEVEEQLLVEALNINQRLKQELLQQDSNDLEEHQQEKHQTLNQSLDQRIPDTNDELRRLAVQFGSRESLSGSLPPIVHSSCGHNSAKAYGSRRQFSHYSPSGIQHAKLQFNSSDLLSSRPVSQVEPEKPVRESTSLWNTNIKWTEKVAYT